MNRPRLNCWTRCSTFSSSSCSIWAQVFPLKDSGIYAGAGRTSSMGRVQKPWSCPPPPFTLTVEGGVKLVRIHLVLQVHLDVHQVAQVLALCLASHLDRCIWGLSVAEGLSLL
ncbi:uncharacterized [Lates japonicus]